MFRHHDHQDQQHQHQATTAAHHPPTRGEAFTAPSRTDGALLTVAHLFGDKNYPKDTFLRHLEGPSGWIPLERLISDDFPRLSRASKNSPSILRRTVQAAPPNFVAELDPFGLKIRRKSLEKRIADYLTYLFSSRNWPTDLYLQVAAENHAGYVPLSVIAQFKGPQSMFHASGFHEPDACIAFLFTTASKLHGSTLELDESACGCRPLTLPTRVRSEVERCLTAVSAPLPPPPLFSTEPLEGLMDEQGFIPLVDLPLSHDLRQLTPSNVAAALQSSTVVECDPSMTRVRLRGRGGAGGAGASNGMDLEYEVLAAATPDHRAVGVGVPPGAAAARGHTDDFSFLPGPVHPPHRHSSTGISIMSYNTLAARYAKFHTYCPQEFLGWKYREALLVQGIQRASPDVVCLQELMGRVLTAHNQQAFSCFHLLAEKLARLGYHCPAWSTKMDHHGRPPVNKHELGNAIFVKSSVFRVIARGRLAYAKVLSEACRAEAERADAANELPARYAQMKTFGFLDGPSSSAVNAYARDLQAHYAKGKQVLVWATLSHMDTGRTVTVATTHIACDWKNPDAQLAQVTVAVRKMEEIQAVYGAHPLVFTGDFNAMPGSAPHRFCGHGCIPSDDPDARPLDPSLGSGIAKSLSSNNGALTHTLTLTSAYPHDPTKVTTRKTGDDPFEGTLDYMWHTPGLTCVNTLPLPRTNQVAAGLPNRAHPSDHVPLGAFLTFS